MFFRDHPKIQFGTFVDTYLFPNKCPLLSIQMMHMNFFKLIGANITQTCIKLLDNAFYLYLTLDRFDLSREKTVIKNIIFTTIILW